MALSYPLYLWRPWAGAVMLVATGGLPWVAVLLANDGPPRRQSTRPHVHHIDGQQIESPSIEADLAPQNSSRATGEPPSAR
ncbi:MAG: DUF3099 domain-containing protein [Pseudonocardiales bacterium]|nr:DUF3099 domain-containing protein [Pseudonocardiales bacterium]